MQIGRGWVHVSTPTALQISRCYKKFKPASLKQSETSAVIIMLMIMRSPLAEQALQGLVWLGENGRLNILIIYFIKSDISLKKKKKRKLGS